jgi:hypothetical protein
MGRSKLLLLVLALAGALFGGPAWGHARVAIGVAIGPFWWPAPWYYPPPYYYSPPVVVQPAPIYIQRPGWGYYPYVRECPGGWRRVPARPYGER